MNKKLFLAVLFLSGFIFPAVYGNSQDDSSDKKYYALGEIIPGAPSKDKSCHEGLTSRDIKENYDKDCVNKGAGGYAGVCIACGDGACDEKYESKCNCPEDCGPSAEVKSSKRP